MSQNLATYLFIALFFILFCENKSFSKDSKENTNDEEEKQSILIDYEELDHEIKILKIRAGNHDEAGINKYYYKVTASALINKNEEKKKELSDRKVIAKELGIFCDITLPALSYWMPNPKKETITYSFQVKGSNLRSLTADLMRTYQLKEDEVAIKIDLEMWLKATKYMFLKDDRKIALVSYFPIPYTPSDQKLKTNQDLSISDETGTIVQIKTLYKVN